MPHYVTGILINIVGSLLINFGTNVMKLSHNLTTERRERGLKLNDFDLELSQDNISMNHSIWEIFWESAEYLFKIGVATFGLGTMLSFISYSFAAQSLLAALGGIQFFSNVIFSSVILKETVNRTQIFATFAIIFGILLCVIFSNHTTKVYSKFDLVALYDRSYLESLAALAVLVVAAQAMHVLYSMRSIANKPLPGTAVVLPVSFSFVSASIGTQAGLQAKCLSELLKHSYIDDANIFIFWETYAIFAVFVCCATFWIRRLNESLKLFDGLIIIPLMQVCWTCLSIIQGGLYFDDFESFTSTQMWGFVGGVAVLLAGVYMLTVTAAVTTEHSDYLYIGRGLLSPMKQQAEHIKQRAELMFSPRGNGVDGGSKSNNSNNGKGIRGGSDDEEENEESMLLLSQIETLGDNREREVGDIELTTMMSPPLRRVVSP